MFDHIPTTRPHTPLLDRINHPADLRHLELSELEQLATELRQYLLFCVGQTGGHFGAGLGVVELTIALHYLYDTPNDRLIWDVGHQSYPHKILTGRRDQMLSMRQSGGLAGFPKRSESPFDTFGVGHSSTSISAALGMALGADMAGTPRRCVAVIGDGAMTAGMAFEGLNHAAHTGQDMLVVLNDNNMSISENVGGLNDYFSRIWASKLYTNLREGGKKVLSKLPPQALELAKKAEEHMKGMVSPATLFEELGFYYVGPIDGHDMERLVHDLGNLRDIEGPKLLHIITQKGKGFSPAEADPVGYHALNKIEPKPTVTSVSKAPEAQKYQDVFGDWLCDMAAADEHLIGITPAMCEGSGMVAFSQRFSDRYHDVAIAEQHAVTLAAGLACEDQKPVVAIYSTFLQRAYDQLIHDVAIQNLDVTFAIDRAGLVGEDGPTHAGSFDLSFLRCIPNMVIAAPADENECRLLLTTAYLHKGPAAVRYPRGKGPGASIEKALLPVEIGKGRKLRQGQRVALLNFGAQLGVALEAAEQLNATVIDMRFVKPLDTELLQQAVDTHELLITLEENSVAGGAGSAVSEWLAQEHILVPIAHIGLPDHFIDHGNHRQLVEQAGISKDNIVRTALQRLGKPSDELIANNQT